jgi:hypothetical protein
VYILRVREGKREREIEREREREREGKGFSNLLTAFVCYTEKVFLA